MSNADSNAAAAGNIVIAARGLTKRYGGVSVVDAINFDIARGEVFGLLGPNGAGKTTTILMMLGLTEISSGTVQRARPRSGARAAAGQAPRRLSARLGRLLRSPHGAAKTSLIPPS